MPTSDEKPVRTDYRPGEKEKGIVREGVKAVATTAAGASLGVAVGIAAITAVGAAEILLPIGLCLWTAGLAGGALGLLVGTKNKNKDKDNE